MYRAASHFELPPSRRTGILSVKQEPGEPESHLTESKRGLSYVSMSVALMFVMLGLQTDGNNAGKSLFSKNAKVHPARYSVKSLSIFASLSS